MDFEIDARTDELGTAATGAPLAILVELPGVTW
jgi:hypothetical protein